MQETSAFTPQNQVSWYRPAGETPEQYQARLARHAYLSTLVAPNIAGAIDEQAALQIHADRLAAQQGQAPAPATQPSPLLTSPQGTTLPTLPAMPGQTRRTAAPLNPSDPLGLAAFVQGQSSGYAAQENYARTIAPNLPDPSLGRDINANRIAYLNQLASQAAGGPSVQQNDLLNYHPATRGTDKNGRPTLTQSFASLQAAMSGDTPQARAAARTAQLAAAYTASQGQPQPMSFVMPDGTRVQGYHSNGNFTRVTPEKSNVPRSSLGDLQYDLGRAVAENRPTDATALQAMIEDTLNPSGKPLTVMEFNFAPELRKQYSGDYGRYRVDFAKQVKGLQASPTDAAPATPPPVAAPASSSGLASWWANFGKSNSASSTPPPAAPAPAAPTPSPRITLGNQTPPPPMVMTNASLRLNEPARAPAAPPAAAAKPYTIESDGIRFDTSSKKAYLESINAAYLDDHITREQGLQLMVKAGAKLNAPRVSN